MNKQYNPETAKKQKARLPLSAYLSYLLIATLLVTGVSFSKFASSGSANDGARVAVVVVDGESAVNASTDLSIGNGEMSATYGFYLTNSDDYGQTSEVSLDYTVFVTMPNGQNLPAGVTVTLTYENGTPYESATPVNGVYTFNGGADFAAGVFAQHNYTLTFTMTDESLVTEDYSFEGIEISVKAEQID